MIRSRSLPSLLIALAASGGLPSHVHAQTAPTATVEDHAQARTLFRQGVAAMKDGKYADARKALMEAWAYRRTYDVAAILGQAELELKLYRDAAEHLDFALKNFAPRESAETLEKVKAGLQTAKQNVAELRVSVKQPQAQVSVDGEPVGHSPLPSSLFVAPGTHTIEARLDAERADRQVIQAGLGTAYNIELDVPKPMLGAPSSGLEVTEPPPEDRAERPNLVPVYVGAGLVVVGAGLGIGYRIAAASSHDDLDRLRERNGANGCSSGTAEPADCDDQRDAAERVDSRRNISTAAFVVAGAAAIGTVAYWFWPRSTSTVVRRPSRVTLGGAPSRGGGSVFISGSF